MLNNEKSTEAISRMKMMGLDEKMIIKPFKRGSVKVSERVNAVFSAVLYDVDNYDYLKNKITEFEKEHNAVVYHVQLSHLVFGDCYSFFYVGDEKEEWEMDKEDIENNTSFVYVWNKSEPLYSEFGSIGIKKSMGGVTRTW